MNPTLAAAFYSCRTSAHYDFDSHPLLIAGFAFNTMKESIKKWVLPKSLDEFMFDPQQINLQGERICFNRNHLFERAFEDGDMNQAARQFTLAFEACI